MHDREHLAGGAETALAVAARGLAGRGHANHLAVIPGEDPGLGTGPCLVHAGAFQDARVLSSGREFGPLVRSLAPDLVLLHNVDPPAGLAQVGAPVVRVVHDLGIACPGGTRSTRWRGRPCERAPGAACLCCLAFLGRRPGRATGLAFRNPVAFRRRLAADRDLGAFLVPSESARRHLLLAGFRSDRIHCVPLGRDALPEPARPWTGAASLLFVGSLVRGKGVDMLLRSMAKSLPALRQSLGDTLTLDVVGAGPEATSLRRLAGRLGIEGCTRWHGRLAGVQLGARYAAATAVVMPSRIPETFGLVGLEAMAAGRPVVATPFGGCDAWLEDGVTGVRARGTDAASLAAALVALVADPELPARLGAAARERHRAHFTEGAFAARLEATIETLAWRGKDRRAGVPV